METANQVSMIHILSTYLKKWSYQENRISLSYSYFSKQTYSRNMVDLRISSPQNMVNEVMNRIMYKAKEELNAEKGPVSVRLVNETEVQRKLHLFLTKILKEFNNNKRSQGKVRMISSRSMDFYYNDYEYEPLDNEVKFFVHLNRGVNKINGDLWSAAIDDLKIALNFDPDNLLANKYMAEALLKSHQVEESIQYFEKFAKADNSLDSWNHLAQAYLKLQRFPDVEKVLNEMAKISSDNLLVRVLRAQTAYLQGKEYISQLEELQKTDDEWLREYLKNEWEFSLPRYGEDESKLWNAATAARYLGYDRPFDLTKRAFNNELPCYFDADKGTIRFAREELDNWVEVQNRFSIDGVIYHVYEDRLNAAEIKLGAYRNNTSKKSGKKAVLS